MRLLKARKFLSLFMALVMIAGVSYFGDGITLAAPAGDYQWAIPDGAGVSSIGEGTNTADSTMLGILSLEGVDPLTLTQSGGAVLDFPEHTLRTRSSNRRIAVWTDLSYGTEGEAAETLDFCTEDNVAAGQVVWTDTLAENGAGAALTLPRDLLYNEPAGTVATKIYVYVILGSSIESRSGNFTTDLISATLTLLPATTPNLAWNVFPIGNGISFTGTDSFVMKLSNVVLDEENLPTRGGILSFDYRVAHNSTRRLLAWTDLSGDAAEIADITFATQENLVAGKIGISESLSSGTDRAELTLPQDILFDKDTGKCASEIYVLFTVDKGPTGDPIASDNYTEISGNRGASSRNGVNGIDLAKEFDIIRKIGLAIPEPIPFATFVTLTPGRNETEMNFAWFTEQGAAGAPVLQLTLASDLEDGGKAWPADVGKIIQVVTGKKESAAYGYDSNKLEVAGLQLNQEYAYRVGDGVEENWSRPYTFKTYDPDSKYNVIVVADPQVGTDSAHAARWQDAVTRSVANADSKGGASFMLNAGDNTEYANAYMEFENFLAPKELMSLPMVTTAGNHDTLSQRAADYGSGPGGSNNETPLGLLSYVYNWPNHDWLGGNPRSEDDNLRGGGSWYMSYGDALYISINSNLRVSPLHDEFLAKAVASHPDATWKIVVFHFDLFGIGTGGSLSLGEMRDVWPSLLDKYGIDLVINGHDHNYGRSQFISGTEPTGWQIEDYQYPTVLDADENAIFSASPPGAYVLPEGIPYLSLGSAADWPKYVPADREWAAYITGTVGVNATAGEYSLMTIDGDTLTFENYSIGSGSSADTLVDSITLKKKADFADLQSLVAGMETLKNTDIAADTWGSFESEITKAKAVKETAAADAIHSAYMSLYKAYYALESTADKAALKELITEVEAVLSTAVEGQWLGQYDVGSIAKIKATLDEASHTSKRRLSTQAEIDAITLALSGGFETFKATAEGKPSIPWIYVHDVPANAPYTMGLVDWMKEDDPWYVDVGLDDKYHYTAHYTKAPYSQDVAGAQRTDVMFAPATLEGGRGVNAAHITKTRIGEWVRYELNVAEAGSYKLTLGAVNPTASIQTVAVRDASQNVLTEFAIPANSPLPEAGWADALLVPAANEIYLPAGKCILELYFVNDGVGAETRNGVYSDGPDVDILVLERTGSMEPPKFVEDPNVFLLPYPYTSIQGVSQRQRGWAITGMTNDNSDLVAYGLPVEAYNKTMKLVLEVAAIPAGGSIQIHIENDAGGTWLPEWAPNVSDIYDPAIGPYGALVFDVANMPAPFNQHFPTIAATKEEGYFDVSYYGNTWEELNFMRAYLVFTSDEFTPPGTIEGAAPSTSRPVPSPASDTYKVAPNDSLRKIAISIYGDKTMWSAIYEANRSVIGSDPNKLRAGLELILPV